MTDQAEEMVRAPEGVESQCFDPVRDPKPSVPGQPLLPLDHDPDPHGSDLSPTGIVAGPARLEHVMPAITVDNILILPRITDVDALIASGGLFHGIQRWVNLPAEQTWTPPRCQDIGAARVTLLSSPDGGALVRLIAGEVAGHAGPGVTHTPITLVHATINPGAELRLPWRREFNGLVYVLAGQGTVGLKRAPIGTGQLAAFGTGDLISITADLAQESRSPNLEVLVLGGESIGEPVAWYGPFVMNTHEELAQAFDDYRRGQMGTIPAAHIGN